MLKGRAAQAEGRRGGKKAGSCRVHIVPGFPPVCPLGSRAGAGRFAGRAGCGCLSLMHSGFPGTGLVLDLGQKQGPRVLTVPLRAERPWP